MLTRANFFKSINNLCKAYGIKEGHKSYPEKEDVEFLMGLLSNEKMTDKQFSAACYAKAVKAKRGQNFELPLAGDFLEVAKLSGKSVEKQAEEQAELVFGSMSRFCGMSNVQFEHPVTNYTVEHSFNGVSTLCWDYSTDNPKIKSISFARREFVKAWLFNEDRGNKQ